MIYRAVSFFVVLALLATTVSVLAPTSVAAQDAQTEFRSPYNSAFTVTAGVFHDRTPAVSFSNNFAGFRQVDPLVAFGQERSHHLHAWLGTRLNANTDINRLFDAPNDWAADSNANERNRGFAGQTVYQGKFDGYSSGVWWPAIWDAPPGKDPVRVTYLDGISSYYVARADHGDQYLEAYPNGLGFLIDQFELKMRDNGRSFNVNFLGPLYWDGKSLTSDDHRSHLSYTRSASHPVAIPQFQTFVKARLGYPDDPTPLDVRLKFGNPGAWVEPHLDYVSGFRQPWFHQWLLDLGPNWGHPNNPLRDCGVRMPERLDRRKLEGVRLPFDTPNSGTSTCSSSSRPVAQPTTSAANRQPTAEAPPTTSRAVERSTGQPTPGVAPRPLPPSTTTSTTASTAVADASTTASTAVADASTTASTAVADTSTSVQEDAADQSLPEESEVEPTGSSPSTEADGVASAAEVLEVVVDDGAANSPESPLALSAMGPFNLTPDDASTIEPHEFCPIGGPQKAPLTSVEQIAAARLEPGLTLEGLGDEASLDALAGSPEPEAQRTAVFVLLPTLLMTVVSWIYLRYRRRIRF